MNLGKYIAEILLEQDRQTIALFPGAFKPPHKGHVEVVKKLQQQADEVVILVSPQTRDTITAEESVAVWDLYKMDLGNNVEVKIVEGSPVREAYDVIKNNPDTNFIVAFGKGEAERFKHMVNYPNVRVFDGGYIQDVNATALRSALASKDERQIEKYLPKGISVVDFLNAIGETKTSTKLPGDKEPPPIGITELQQPMDTTSKYHDLVVSELEELERTSEEFNVELPDLQYAFEIGNEVILTDNIWSKLENSDSYGIKNLEQAIKLANKYKKDWKSIINAVKNEQQLPPPLVLNYGDGKYYLVAGNTRLMIYRALGVQPVVLMANLDLTVKEGSEVFDIDSIKLKDEQIDLVKKFIKYAVRALDLHSLPSSLTLSYDTNQAKSRHTFGYFDPNNNKIWLYVKDRNVADILRTLAHEFVHRKQAEQGRIEGPHSGETGSPIENEANAMAGVLLRNFGIKHEDIYEGLKKNLNEAFDLNDKFDWKWIGGKTNKYTFNTGQTEYELIFQPGAPGDYERKFAPMGVSGNKLDYNVSTNEFKANKIYATVMDITLDFLKKNKDWKEILISPVDAKRNRIVKAWFDKTLPKDKYTFVEDEHAVFHIYRKIK